MRRVSEKRGEKNNTKKILQMKWAPLKGWIKIVSHHPKLWRETLGLEAPFIINAWCVCASVLKCQELMNKSQQSFLKPILCSSVHLVHSFTWMRRRHYSLTYKDGWKEKWTLQEENGAVSHSMPSEMQVKWFLYLTNASEGRSPPSFSHFFCLDSSSKCFGSRKDGKIFKENNLTWGRQVGWSWINALEFYLLKGSVKKKTFGTFWF